MSLRMVAAAAGASQLRSLLACWSLNPPAQRQPAACRARITAVRGAHQPAVEMAIPSSRKSITTVDRMVSKECQSVSPNLRAEPAGA
jgi:hypothetical protein